MPDESVRRQAIEVLGKIGLDAKVAVPILTGTLKDGSQFVRRQAVGTLGTFGPDGVPGLIVALRDKEDAMRHEATLALARIGPKAHARHVRAH